MHYILYALIPLVLGVPPVVLHVHRQARFRRRCLQMRKAHRDGYQRFLAQHAKG